MCTEIIEYTSPDEVAVCVLLTFVIVFCFLRDVEDSACGNFVIKLVFSSSDLDNLVSVHSIFVRVLVSLCFGGAAFPGNLASIALSSFVDGDTFNFQKLYEVTKVVTKNLNKVIDRNYYPVEASTEKQACFLMMISLNMTN